MSTTNRYAKAARKAREMTNKELATEISSLTPINRERLQELLPRKRDKEAFIELMKVVEAESDVDEKLSYLRDNLTTVGKVVFKALKLFI
jgi:hypothetical protein